MGALSLLRIASRDATATKRATETVTIAKKLPSESEMRRVLKAGADCGATLLKATIARAERRATSKTQPDIQRVCYVAATWMRAIPHEAAERTTTAARIRPKN